MYLPADSSDSLEYREPSLGQVEMSTPHSGTRVMPSRPDSLVEENASGSYENDSSDSETDSDSSRSDQDMDNDTAALSGNYVYVYHIWMDVSRVDIILLICVLQISMMYFTRVLILI